MKISSVAVIGYGRFGKTLESILPRIFPEVSIAMVQRDIKKAVHADIIIPAVPIREFEEVIKALAPHVQSAQIVMDVCSVKLFPVEIMQRYLPGNAQIMATHPMFGPGTLAKTKGSLKGLKMVIDSVRMDSASEKFIIDSFTRQGIELISMTSLDHDKYAAQFHFSSQFVASVLKDMSVQKTPIDTPSVGVLHDFMEFVQTDSHALLQDMYRYNPYCKKQLEHITSTVERIAQSIKQ